MNEADSTQVKKKSSDLPLNTPFFYGWVIVGLAALTMFFSGPGQTYSVSTFIDSYITEFNWSRSQVSSIYSIGTLIAGLTMGMIGRMFDKRGHRIMTTLIAFTFGLACVGMSFVSNLGFLLIGFFSIRLLGQGSMSLSSSTIVPQWFKTKKGRALSIASIGSIIGSAALPPLNIWFIEKYSWRFGWRFWAVLLICVMAPIAYILIRNKPEDVGLWPDNIEVQSNNTNSEKLDLEKEDAWTVKEAIRTRTFWLLVFCSMVPSAILTGMFFHQISIMGLVGLTPMNAALVFSTIALMRLPIVLIAGPIADKIKPKYLLAVSEGILFIALIILLAANSLQMALVYGILVGIMMGILTIAEGVIWPEYFGRKYLGSIMGILMMAGVVGSAFGPLPFGIAFDIFGSYHEMLTISLVFPIVAVVAALLAHRPQHQLEPQ